MSEQATKAVLDDQKNKALAAITEAKDKQLKAEKARYDAMNEVNRTEHNLRVIDKEKPDQSDINKKTAAAEAAKTELKRAEIDKTEATSELQKKIIEARNLMIGSVSEEDINEMVITIQHEAERNFRKMMVPMMVSHDVIDKIVKDAQITSSTTQIPAQPATTQLTTQPALTQPAPTKPALTQLTTQPAPAQSDPLYALIKPALTKPAPTQPAPQPAPAQSDPAPTKSAQNAALDAQRVDSYLAAITAAKVKENKALTTRLIAEYEVQKAKNNIAKQTELEQAKTAYTNANIEFITKIMEAQNFMINLKKSPEDVSQIIKHAIDQANTNLINTSAVTSSTIQKSAPTQPAPTQPAAEGASSSIEASVEVKTPVYIEIISEGNNKYTAKKVPSVPGQGPTVPAEEPKVPVKGGKYHVIIQRTKRNKRSNRSKTSRSRK